MGFFNELGRSFRGGMEKAKGKDESVIELNLLIEKLADSGVPDTALVEDVFRFLGKFPEYKGANNFQAILKRIMDQRPGTVELIQKRLG